MRKSPSPQRRKNPRKAISKITKLPAPTHAETVEKLLKYLNEYEQDPAAQPLKTAWEHMNTSRGWK